MSTRPFDARVIHDVFCVLYAQGTGQIVFVHRVITLGDAPPQRAEDIEADARRIMHTTVTSLEGRPAADLVALIVSPDALQRGRSYAVDCSTRTLIEGPEARTKMD
jgi:hypothetical protein